MFCLLLMNVEVIANDFIPLESYVSCDWYFYKDLIQRQSQWWRHFIHTISVISFISNLLFIIKNQFWLFHYCRSTTVFLSYRQHIFGWVFPWSLCCCAVVDSVLGGFRLSLLLRKKSFCHFHFMHIIYIWQQYSCHFSCWQNRSNTNILSCQISIFQAA